MPKILMVAAEATPFIKTGGLADVMEALPAALHDRGIETAVLLPRYRKLRVEPASRLRPDFPVFVGSRRFSASLDFSELHGVPYYFFNCPELFDRDELYGNYPDNYIRFAALAAAALQIARWVFRPNILHCHDWHSGLVPAYLKGPFAADPTFVGMKTVYTIHNLGYHVSFTRAEAADLGLGNGLFTPGGLEFYGNGNFMKSGLALSDKLTTVSPTYAKEIQTEEEGFGFDGVLRGRAADLVGILNGVDYAAWNPETDTYLAEKERYSVQDLRGKAACKRSLLSEMGLPPEAAERPTAGMISRMTSQKGFDLVQPVAEQMLDLGLNLVVLGSGDAAYQDFFRDLAARRPDRCGVRIGFDEGLAHRIEAGADMFLMPSRYEPCGLNQMYSLRYGTVPVVRATGGLDDTIDEETGFKFRDYSAAALLDSVRKAVNTFGKPKSWRTLVQNGMRRDNSWNASAGHYADLYRQLLG